MIDPDKLLQEKMLRVTQDNERLRLLHHNDMRVRKAIKRKLRGCSAGAGMTELQRAYESVLRSEELVAKADALHTCASCVWIEQQDVLHQRCKPCSQAFQKDS